MKKAKKVKAVTIDFRVEYKVGCAVFTPLTKRAREYMEKRNWLGEICKDGEVKIEIRFVAPAIASIRNEDMTTEEVRKRREGD